VVAANADSTLSGTSYLRGVLMLCILRVKVRKSELSDIRKAAAMRPYRIDENVSGTPQLAYLHYDIMDQGISFSEGLRRVSSFLVRNDNDIALLSSSKDSELELDIGINLFQDDYSRNLGIDVEFMEVLVKYRISLTLSLYQTSLSEETVQ
jgi:hypothetical protein